MRNVPVNFKFASTVAIASLLLSVAYGDYSLQRSNQLYLDAKSGKLFAADSIVQSQELFSLSQGTLGRFKEVSGDVDASVNSTVQIITFNVNKTLVKVTTKGTILESPDTSGLAALTAFLDALKGSGLSADLVATVVNPARSLVNPVEVALQDCISIEKRATELKNLLNSATNRLSMPEQLQPPSLSGPWVGNVKDKDVETFDERETAGLSAIALADNPAELKNLIRVAFKARMEAARALLIAGKASEAKYMKYYDSGGKPTLALFQEYYVCDPSESLKIEGNKFEIEMSVAGKDLSGSSINFGRSLVITTKGGPASFFQAVSPLGYGRIVQNKFTVVNNAAVQTQVENRYGLDNLAYTFNYQPNGSSIAFSFGFTHPWNNLKGIATNNVGILLGVSKWWDSYGLTLGYVDLPVQELGTNGTVTTISDIQTKFAHHKSWFLGISFKVGSSPK